MPIPDPGSAGNARPSRSVGPSEFPHMPSGHPDSSPRSRPHAAADPIEPRLAAALRPVAGGDGLEARILEATAGPLTEAAAADRAMAARLREALAPPSEAVAGLAGRVHAASVAGLPSSASPRLETAATWDQPAVVGRITAARAVAGRLAMAASVGLLAVLGWWTTRPSVGPVAGPGGPLAAAPVERLLVADVSRLEDPSWASLESVYAIETELAMLDRWDVGSYAEVAGEIEAIIPEFLLADPGR